jgi:hypothetical protein
MYIENGFPETISQLQQSVNQHLNQDIHLLMLQMDNSNVKYRLGIYQPHYTLCSILQSWGS